MSYEITTCPICGAGNLKQTGVEEKDGQIFPKYKCPSCDAELSSYDKYQKALKKAQMQSAVESKEEKSVKEEVPVSEPTQRTAYVNVAADVYKKAIKSTIALAATIDEGSKVGTGTLVSKNGYFITNAHVVTEISDNHKNIVDLCDDVYGAGGEHNFRFNADFVYANPELDLALLKTEPDESLVPAIFKTEEVCHGEAVYAIGNSKGEGLCIVEGIVSDVHRSIGGKDYIMVTAPVTHGNSGGPVFNAEGKLIGVVKGGRSDSSAMNYVIPIKTIIEFLQEAKDMEDCDF